MYIVDILRRNSSASEYLSRKFNTSDSRLECNLAIFDKYHSEIVKWITIVEWTNLIWIRSNTSIRYYCFLQDVVDHNIKEDYSDNPNNTIIQCITKKSRICVYFTYSFISIIYDFPYVFKNCLNLKDIIEIISFKFRMYLLL